MTLAAWSPRSSLLRGSPVPARASLCQPEAPAGLPQKREGHTHWGRGVPPSLEVCITS